MLFAAVGSMWLVTASWLILHDAFSGEWDR